MPNLTTDEWAALSLSLRVALVSVLLALPPALALATWLARRQFFFKPLVEAVLFLPMILPPVVTGYALLRWFGNQGVLGGLLARLGIPIAFHWTGAVLAAAVMAFPLLVLSIRLSIESVDQRLEAAAATLGATYLRRFFTITLPLSARGIVAGSVLAFARAFGEFGATITFVSSIPNETRTLPIAIYELISNPGGDAGVQRLTVVALAVALTATLAAAMVMRGQGLRSGNDD